MAEDERFPTYDQLFEGWKQMQAERDRLRGALCNIERQLVGYAEFTPAKELALIAQRALAGSAVETAGCREHAAWEHVKALQCPVCKELRPAVETAAYDPSLGPPPRPKVPSAEHCPSPSLQVCEHSRYRSLCPECSDLK